MVSPLAGGIHRLKFAGGQAATNGGIPVNAFDNPVTPTVNIKVSGGDFTNCTGIKTTSQFFDDNVAGKNAAVQAPASITIDCSAAPWTTYDQIVAKTTQTVTPPTNPRPSEGGNEGGNDNPNTGDVIAIVLATMAASGLGVVVLKKKEF